MCCADSRCFGLGPAYGFALPRGPAATLPLTPGRSVAEWHVRRLVVVRARGRPPRSPPSGSGVPPACTYLVTTPAERYGRRHTKSTDVTDYAPGAIGASLRGHRRARLHIRAGPGRLRGSAQAGSPRTCRPIRGIQGMRKLCASKEKISAFAHDDPPAIFPAAWVWGSIYHQPHFNYRGSPAEYQVEATVKHGHWRNR